MKLSILFYFHSWLILFYSVYLCGFVQIKHAMQGQQQRMLIEGVYFLRSFYIKLGTGKSGWFYLNSNSN